jgi:NADPH2:quinone reductase
MAAAMRAMMVARPGGPEVLQERDVPVPQLRPGHVRVAVRSAGINFRDSRQRTAVAPDSELPLIPGSDFAGLVAEVGDGLEGMKETDRVFGLSPYDGAYSEQVVAPAVAVRSIPEGMGFDQAAAIPADRPRTRDDI